MTQNLYYFKQNCKTPKHFEMYKEMPKQPTKKEIKLSSDWYYYLLTTEKKLSPYIIFMREQMAISRNEKTDWEIIKGLFKSKTKEEMRKIADLWQEKKNKNIFINEQLMMGETDMKKIAKLWQEKKNKK